MAKFILIETSTALCSCAVWADGKVAAIREDAGRSHSANTALFIQEMLSGLGLSVKDCDAVCLGMGPGSYTGLRVGSSTAKGLCLGAGIPLIAVSSLDVLVQEAIETGAAEGFGAIVPMADARRMEVYTAVYSPAGERLGDITAAVITPDSFAGELSAGRVLFTGEGAPKCASVITSLNASFRSALPSTRYMGALAEREFAAGNFRDTAYFEPLYLKDFIATTSKKHLW